MKISTEAYRHLDSVIESKKYRQNHITIRIQLLETIKYQQKPMDVSIQLLEALKYQEEVIQMSIQLLESIKYQHGFMEHQNIIRSPSTSLFSF